MNFSGFQKTTLKDYPEHIACIVFVSGCNFRCPYCHNSSLVLNEVDEAYSEDEILSYLIKRDGILEGICISGGEPTMYHGLKDFIIRVKQNTGLKVKLDTNGTNPNLLKELIDENLIDYVAMDIKSGLSGYKKASGITDDALIENVKISINILLEDKVDYEFRTTIVKGIHEFDDFKEISELIRGTKRYFIQNYMDSGDILEKRSRHSELESFCEDEIKEILGLFINNKINTAVRG